MIVAAVMDLVESTLIVTAIALTDPLFGIGVYFLGTHSFRRSVRLAGTAEVMPSSAASRSSTDSGRCTPSPLLIPTFVLVAAWCRLQFGTIDAWVDGDVLGFFLGRPCPTTSWACDSPRFAAPLSAVAPRASSVSG